MPESKTAANPRRRSRKAGRSTGSVRVFARCWLRRVVIIVLVLVALPLALTLVYAVPAVHPVSMLMIGDAASLSGYRRDWMPLDDMGNALPHSVLMSEDGQFCSHYGVDWGAMNEVVQDALDGEGLRGASTIPMQTVKNLFLWNGRSYIRKALEVPLALYFDAVVSKKRILEIYLNIAEWGPDLYGAEAAAQHYFGRSVKSLSRRQAALLAVTLPNPAVRNPAKPSNGMNRLAARVERLALKAGGYVDCLQ